MSEQDKQANNPLHGLKLEQIVTQLEEHLGWDELAKRVRINCFAKDPSVSSSLKFLRRNLWARDKVEILYLECFHPKKAREVIKQREQALKAEKAAEKAAGKNAGHAKQKTAVNKPQSRNSSAKSDASAKLKPQTNANIWSKS